MALQFWKSCSAQNTKKHHQSGYSRDDQLCPAKRHSKTAQPHLTWLSLNHNFVTTFPASANMRQVTLVTLPHWFELHTIQVSEGAQAVKFATSFTFSALLSACADALIWSGFIVQYSLCIFVCFLAFVSCFSSSRHSVTSSRTDIAVPCEPDNEQTYPAQPPAIAAYPHNSASIKQAKQIPRLLQPYQTTLPGPRPLATK